MTGLPQASDSFAAQLYDHVAYKNLTNLINAQPWPKTADSVKTAAPS